MAVFAGTNIVNDGLVFHFDLQNSVKSWKGKPTSNLIDGGTNRADGVTSPKRIGGHAGIARTVVSEYYSEERPHVLHYYSTNDTGYSEISQEFSINVANGSTYSYSFDYKQIAGSDQALSNLIVYGNGYKQPDASNYGSNLQTSDISLEDGWYRRTITYTATYAGKNHLRMNLITGGWSGTNEGDFEFYFDNFQIEEGSVSSRYTNGIRLDTATIIDLSPTKSTITASNLTYRQDDTPTFDGTDDLLTVPHSSVGHPTTSYSTEAWVKLDSSQGNAYPRVWDKGTILLHLSQSAPFSIALNTTTSGGLRQTGAGSAFSHSVWTHIVTSYDGQFGKIYVNGELITSRDFGSVLGPSLSTSDMAIGSRIGLNRYLNGEIDQVRLYWDKVLSEAEVKQNFEATRSRYGI